MASTPSLMVYFWVWLIVGNPLVIMWQGFYIGATVYPLSHQRRATSEFGPNLQSEFGMICFLGLPLGLINAIFGCCYLIYPIWNSWDKERFLKGLKKRDFLRKVLYWLLMTLVVAVVVFMAIAMFVSPFLSAEMRWKTVYRDTCQGMDVRVYLDSAESRPAREVEFVMLSSQEKFMMSMNPDPWTVGLDDRGVYNFSVITGENSSFVPAWDHISYDFNERKLEVLSTNDTVIKDGDFNLGSNFRIPALNIRGDLDAFARRCVFDPTVEIFDTTRSGGKVVMKTAQFKICDLLQVCADGGLGDLTAVPVGLLILQRSARRGGCCSRGHRVPGIEGRD